MILDKISQFSANKIAIQAVSASGQTGISYGELIEQVHEFKHYLVDNKIMSVALSCDNTPPWLIIDLACQSAEVVFTPIPAFFSAQQVQHLLQSTKPDLLLFDADFAVSFADKSVAITSPIASLQAVKFCPDNQAQMPKGTSKITFTSGSTGEPKGVCLSAENQLNVALALVDKIAIKAPNHLCLLSFSTLLENVAGLYAPLLAGGTIYMASTKERGFNGAQLTDLNKLLTFIRMSKPQSMILVPELLQVLLLAISQGWLPPSELAFIAVGGSRVSEKLLNQAKQAGLPVYQGYGLSECASVVSLNSKTSSSLPRENQGAGEILAHLTAEIIQGELVLTGNAFLGYLNMPESWYPQKIYTGDLVNLHGDHIEISGRKKNIIINSYGRNISPEWPEAELMASGIFQQVVVFGDSQPFCIALLVPLSPKISSVAIQQVITQVNQGLPDYAQIKNFIHLNESMTINDGLITANGRPKRDAIARYYAVDIEQAYAQQLDKSHLPAAI